jgi:hypothetical protein
MSDNTTTKYIYYVVWYGTPAMDEGNLGVAGLSSYELFTSLHHAEQFAKQKKNDYFEVWDGDSNQSCVPVNSITLTKCISDTNYHIGKKKLTTEQLSINLEAWGDFDEWMTEDGKSEKSLDGTIIYKPLWSMEKQWSESPRMGGW